ncbi:MAG: hypothetical protein HOK41_12350 [Nitrospina sp.]|nr:hypothetical protein [Nitrospina sp.]
MVTSRIANEVIFFIFLEFKNLLELGVAMGRIKFSILTILVLGWTSAAWFDAQGGRERK